MITGNKGEWSEIYTLFKLLGDGKVHAGDAEMNKLDLYYPILDVIRQESCLKEYKPDTEKNIVIVLEDGTEMARFPMQRFRDESKALLLEIGKASDRAFSVEQAENFMTEIGCEKLKAKSQDKADIHIVIHDLRTHMKPNLGFSIKSQLGHASTLLNAGMTTNIRFRVEGGINADLAKTINEIPGHLERMKTLYDFGFSLRYDDVEHPTFRNNLLFIDSNLPNFIGRCLIEDSLEKSTDIRNIVTKVSEENPFGYSGSNVLMYYEHKMKQLLLASALGMTPAKEWNGRYDANGGYLVVKDDGEIVCYHFYNQNDVEDYLYNNTKFDRPSRDRYKYGSVYEMDGEFFFDLNLQIRFKK